MTEVKLVELSSIVPDPNQPRRVIPADAARAILKGQHPVARIYQMYLRLPDSDWSPHTMRMHTEITELAASIHEAVKAHPDVPGIINPITAYPIEGGRYMIETGELRFWAMVMLHTESTDEEAGRYDKIPVRVVKHHSAIRQMVENLQQHSLNSMEIAWGLKSAWDIMQQETPPVDFSAPGAKKPAHRPKGWPNWLAVARRTGMAERTVYDYTPLLELEPEAQAIIHAYDIPERRLRYMLSVLSRPERNADITAILKKATGGPEIWTEAQIRKEVDKLLGISKSDTPPSPKQIVSAVKHIASRLAPILSIKKFERDAFVRYINAFCLEDPEGFAEMIYHVKDLRQILTAMIETFRDAEVANDK
ncbi:MAG: ParB N-terminal domain-containing protein [Thermoflexales bacterium]|nr:ParB N-terminal domain-containing protein [Thermoflexales bacterium]